MRRSRAWLALLAVLPACGGGDTTGGGDAAGADSGAISDGNSPASDGSPGDASSDGTDANTFDAVDDDSPIVCTGVPQPFQGTCITPGASDAGNPLFCSEFTGSEYTPADVMAACSFVNAEYATQPCPTAGLVGKCIYDCGLPTESVGYFYFGSATVPGLMQSCPQNGGYFVP